MHQDVNKRATKRSDLSLSSSLPLGRSSIESLDCYNFMNRPEFLERRRSVVAFTSYARSLNTFDTSNFRGIPDSSGKDPVDVRQVYAATFSRIGILAANDV